MKFHHLGIIVKNLKIEVENMLQSLPIKKKSKIYLDKTWKVKVIFLTDKSGVIYELIEPISKQSPVYNALSKKLNILNHIAYKTKNFERINKELIKKNFFPVSKALRAKAFKNKKIRFFYSPQGFILEIIQA